jgi:hypothetical protein
MEESKFKSFMSSAVSGTKKFGAAAKNAGTSVKNNIGKSMSSVAETTKDIVNQSGEIGAKLAAVGGAVVAGIMNPMKGLVGLFALSLKYATEWEVRATATARATGLVGENLGEAQRQVAGLHERYRHFGESIDGSIQTIQGMNNALGNVDYATAQMADHITRFSIGAGIGKDTSAKIMSNIMLTQGATEKTAMQAQNFAKDLSNAAGVPINLVMDDLANISDDVHGFLGSNPKELVKATVEARRLGLSLESTAKIANGLLDFESSIEAEMEAQVLTGKTLNFDKARQLAMDGDQVGAAKEMLRQVGGLSEFNKMNVVQKQALAKATNMSVGEMKKALGTGEKEADLEEQRAEDMAKAQMDQAKGVKIIATTMEGLNATLHRLGKVLGDILMPYAQKFMKFLGSEDATTMIADVETFVVTKLTPAIREIVGWLGQVWDWLTVVGADGETNIGKIFDAFAAVGSFLGNLIMQIAAFNEKVGAGAASVARFVFKTWDGMIKLLTKAFPKGIKGMFGMAAKAVGKAGSVLLKVFKKVPIIGALISFGFAVSKFRKGDMLGAGMEIASGLASFIPGVGTGISMAIDTASMVRDVSASDDEAADFISRGGRMQKFRKDDLVIGGTKLDGLLRQANATVGGGGGGDNTAILTALNNIANLLSQPGEVIMDGKKVGETIAMSKSYVGN